MYGFFSLLFLPGIHFLYGVTPDTLSTCSDKTETPKLSLQISTYEGFPILVILLDIVPELDLYLFTVFSVSFLLIDLDLSND